MGVSAAVLSSALGGMAAAFTRHIIGFTDPITLAAFRFGAGFALLLPLALALRCRWPRGRDWIGVLFLGLLFFALFFALYNLSLAFTTALRGTLALSVLPLVTMTVAAVFRVERMTFRKTAGVTLAITGVVLSLGLSLGTAPAGAWRGDLIMLGATLCMAAYNVWSRPFIARSSALAFVTAGMGVGALCLSAIAYMRGGFAAATEFGPAQWLAVAYLGVFGAAAAFFLWVYALERASPTRVANTITVNPVAASILAAFLVGEPIGAELIAGVAAVFVGIWIATMRGHGT
jgi:drug/metabolite transporter (DMT)-like permease